MTEVAEVKRRWKLGVTFNESYRTPPKVYYYQLVQDQPEPEVGDNAIVVVEDVFKMVTITSVEEVTGSLDDIAWKFIHVLLSYADIRREREREIQRKLLRDKINKLKKQHIELMELKQLAEAIPEAAELVEQLKALG